MSSRTSRDKAPLSLFIGACPVLCSPGPVDHGDEMCRGNGLLIHAKNL